MSEKKKLSPEEKVSLIKQCKRGKISILNASRIAGVERTTFYRWITLYESEGISVFQPDKEKKVYTDEMKLEAVQSYLKGEGSMRVICKKHGIRNISLLCHWIKVYNAHREIKTPKKTGGKNSMRKGRSTSQEERIQIAKECIANGKNYGEISLKYGVSYQQARTWTEKYKALGAAGLEDRRGKRKKDQEPRTELEAAQIEIERLKHQLYITEMERDLLKKLQEIERRDAYRE